MWMLHKHSNNETWWGTQMNNSWSEAQPKVIKQPFIDIKMNYFMLFCERFTSSACDIQHKYIYIIQLFSSWSSFPPAFLKMNLFLHVHYKWNWTRRSIRMQIKAFSSWEEASNQKAFSSWSFARLPSWGATVCSRTDVNILIKLGF